MPVKSFLDDPPTLGHPKKCKEVRHADPGTGQLARPVCDFKPDNSNRFGYVNADDSGLNIGRWSISLDPVEQESESNRELIAGVTKERSLRVESGTHQLAVALLATVNVQLKSFQNGVMFGLGFRGGHAHTVRPLGSGHQRTNLAKEGAAFHAGLSPIRKQPPTLSVSNLKKLRFQDGSAAAGLDELEEFIVSERAHVG
jgi:hypothetical protein